jgi:hypothetical protein
MCGIWPTASRPSGMTRVLMTCVVMCVLVPASATATDRHTLLAILRDCEDGRLNGTYRLADIRAALRAIPAETDQYSDCRTVLGRQLAAAHRAAPTDITNDARSTSTPAIRPGELIAGAEKEPTLSANPAEQRALNRVALAPPPGVTASGLVPATGVAMRNALPAVFTPVVALIGVALLLTSCRLRPR